MPMDDSMTATMAANAIDEKIKMAGLCEKVEELEEDHSHLREKLHRYKMDNKIEKIEEEKEMYPGVIPTMPIGGYNNCNDNALWALMAMGGLWGNNRRNEGCCETLALSNQITGEGRATVDSILSTSNMNQNAYNFGNLNTNMATGFGNLNTNLASQSAFVGDKIDMNATRLAEATAQTAAEIRNVRDGQFDLSRQSAQEILGLSRELCSMNLMTSQQFSQVQAALKDGDYALARQIADCCCATQRAIDGVKYESEKQYAALSREISDKLCATNAHITAGNQRILDQMACDREKAKDAVIANLAEENRNMRQTAVLLQAIAGGGGVTVPTAAAA